ncbi:hypothetical protein RsTz2092_02790 [Deferribacterales bacterium RsTz2092]
MHSFNVNKFRHLLFIFISLVVIVCIYALLSFVYVGRTDAVPLKWQKHLEISQQELYKNLDNFSVVGVDKNVLRSDTSDKSSIIVDLGNRTSKDYKRVSLLISRLNTTNGGHKGTWLSFTDKSGKAVNKTFSLLKDGFNSSKLIQGSVPRQFTITTWNGNAGFSMELERVYLSKYPVLPNSFIAPFIMLSIFALAISWCCFYKGLHRWLLARNWALCIIIIAVQLMFVAYYRNQAVGAIGEEMGSIMAANSARVEIILSPTVDISKCKNCSDGSVWYSQQNVIEAMTAQSDEGLAHLNKLRSRWLIHSPTHYIQLHLVSMLFPNTFSFWIGVLLNVPYYICICVLLYAISRRFLSGKLALLPLIFYASSAAIYTPLWARSYTLVSFFCMLSVYLVLEILTQPKLTNKVYILLAICTFLGVDAHNSVGVWLVAISFVPVLWLFKNKRFIEIAKCATAIVVAGIMYLIFIVHPIFDARYAPPADLEPMSVSLFLKMLLQSLVLLNNNLFGGIINWYLLTVAIMGILYYNNVRLYIKPIYPNSDNCEKNTSPQTSSVLLYASIATAIVVYILAYECSEAFLRYPSMWHLVAMISPMVLLLVLFINELIGMVATRLLTRKMLASIILMLSFISFFNRVAPEKICMHPGFELPTTNYAKIAEAYRDMPAIGGVSAANVGVLVAMNLRESINIESSETAFNRALEHVKSDKSIIVFLSPRQKDVFVLDTLRRHGYTKRAPFIDGISWIFSKER